MHQEFQKSQLEIVCILHLKDKLRHDKQKCMQVAIKWHVLRFLLYAISILGNHFVNWQEWHYTEMVWREYGEQIKVSTKDLCVGLDHSLIKLNYFENPFQYFHFKSCVVEQSYDGFEVFIQLILFLYQRQSNLILNPTR